MNVTDGVNPDAGRQRRAPSLNLKSLNSGNIGRHASTRHRRTGSVKIRDHRHILTNRSTPRTRLQHIGLDPKKPSFLPEIARFRAKGNPINYNGEVWLIHSLASYSHG